jgi:predicted enzyme related to lactoylglutathione lyase
MQAGGIAAVMLHVGDVPAAQAWYQALFPQAQPLDLGVSGVGCLGIGTARLEFVQADEKVAAGAAGSVVYWQVADFDSALAHALSQGATLYRGPMHIEAGQAMCQVRDPWGNCIGLRGPAVAAQGTGPVGHQRFELRRQSDALVYRFAREARADGHAGYCREDLALWIVRWPALGWVAMDEQTGEVTGRPWDVPPPLQFDHPPEGVWVSRKGPKSYVYELRYLDPELPISAEAPEADPGTRR